MVKAKFVHLVNYCGYEDCTFSFVGEDGEIMPLAMFYGPNGIGKTTCMRAIQLAANPSMFRGRERNSEMLLRKSIYDVDYLPGVDAVKKDTDKKEMRIEVLFETDDGEKAVVIDNKGLLVNELPKTNLKDGYSYFGDADHPMATNRFMLNRDNRDVFLDFCEEVYGYKCDLGSPVSQQGLDVYTDFIIHKGDVRVHFKSMSAGEKKIATLVSDILQPTNTEGRDIIMVDNVEMHVYFKRHVRMIEKLYEHFHHKQMLVTTHSPVIIDYIDEEFHFDLEKYRPGYALLESE
jgi:AAA15 family ATPase/GTPase